MNKSTLDRLAVCSWSLQPSTPQDLISKLQQTGINRVQLALDPLRESPAIWGSAPGSFMQSGIAMVSGMFGCVGEDYSTLDSIRLTGGIAPDHTWEQNLANAKATALLARKLGLGFVAFHAGFVPHDSADPAYSKMIDRVATIADVFAEQQLSLGLETGQETAADLVKVLQKLSRPNVGVNFDPANMILYDKGNPIEALRQLGPWVRQVHMKDATRTKTPGTWGTEVPLGTGEVDWPAFFSVLKQINYAGDFVIEREAGDQRAADIRTAREVILKTASK
jgi:sugar phosphate isomerase/epimerase